MTKTSVGNKDCATVFNKIFIEKIKNINKGEFI